ncbi:MAG: ATP-binding cassette domain-containing protein [Verrucomicrobia bacterium]|jgi:iron complex transport system ATP-binding protein|nr:ATP-binding cassette domain-containing protein [Verrucomicrobiota bacterium]|tara:strand:- start:9629 stop:10417 length:789 start_codon:yes stop_codon:yes gene_type:complete
MSEPFFEIQNANVWRGDVLALRDLGLSLRIDESVAILGANGAGKSSLLKLMTGEVRAEARPGTSCRVFGEEQWCLEELRHRVGLVMPEEVARFMPDEVSVDVVLSAFRGAYGRTGDMRFKASEKERAAKVMADVGVANLAGRLFGQLSSGEKRRFLIARALVHQPQILVLDEPSTALDFAARLAMLERLRAVAQNAGTLVLVTHDPGEILPEINRVILLQNGRVVADGAKKDILKSDTLSHIYGMDLKLRWLEGWPVVRAVK